MKKFDVVILGAGASGLLCAITAAQRGRQVLVLEKANKVGKKILMSGGGRCNFTNYEVGADNFISDNSHFCKSALSRYTQWDFIAMVEEDIIEYEERKHGQLFCTGSAKEILAMLLNRCEALGVRIETHCDIESVEQTSTEGRDQEKSAYQIYYSQQDRQNIVAASSLVVATGALSIPTLGGSGIGYDIAKKFSLALRDRRAGLVPFMFSDDNKLLCERLSGLALEVEVTCEGQSFTENMLFTHRGISGPAMLQISNYWRPGNEISINLLPALDLKEYFFDAKYNSPKIGLKALLGKQLAKSLVLELQTLWWPEHQHSTMAEFTDNKLEEIAKRLSQWRLKPSATEGYRTAEVTVGGVCTAAISSKTMEVKKQPGLYFIGEVLDVTGHLGGFNFQWAWSSGFCAGQFV